MRNLAYAITIATLMAACAVPVAETLTPDGTTPPPAPSASAPKPTEIPAPTQEDAYQASLNQVSTELGGAIVRIDTDDSGMARAYLTETPQPGDLPFGVFSEGKWMWYQQYTLNQQAGDLGLQPGQFVFHLGDGASMSDRLDSAVVMDNKGEVIATWNAEKGKWQVDEIAGLIALLPQDLLKDPVIAEQFREILVNLDKIPAPGIENGAVVGGGSFDKYQVTRIVLQILGIVVKGNDSYLLTGDKRTPIVIALSLNAKGSTSYFNSALPGGFLPVTSAQIEEMKKHIGASVTVDLMDTPGTVYAQNSVKYPEYYRVFGSTYFTDHLDTQETFFKTQGISVAKANSQGVIWQDWEKLDDDKKVLYITAINPVTEGFIRGPWSTNFGKKNNDWQQLIYPQGIIPFDDSWYTLK